MPRVPRTYMAHPLTEHRISIDECATLYVALRRYQRDEETALSEALRETNSPFVDDLARNVGYAKRLVAVFETAWAGGNARIMWGDE